MKKKKKKTKCDVAENVKSDSRKLRDKNGCDNYISLYSGMRYFFILFQAFLYIFNKY